MMRRIYSILVISSLAWASCNNNGGEKKAPAAEVPKAAPMPITSNLNDSATRKLVTVITQYYALKNALVATKDDQASAASAQLSIAAKDLQGYLLRKDGMPGPLKPYLDTVIMETRAIGELNDKTCEHQRIAFGVISSSIYAVLKTAEIKNMRVYHKYCPMAFNEKGATWLSDDTVIKNPYFGDKMLECGEVTDSL